MFFKLLPSRLPHPFGMQMEQRSYTFNIGDYRFGFNTQERDDEIYGQGNSNTAQFWQYDCRISRRWNLDPKGIVGTSDYSCFGNQPLFYTDHEGDTLRGVSRRSAQRTKTIIDETFEGSKYDNFRNLINIGADGRTFDQITQADFQNATSGLTADEQALAEGYFHAITDGVVHNVSVVDQGQTIDGPNAAALNAAGGTTASGASFTAANTGSDIDQAFGGGVNMPVAGGDLTIIVRNSTVPITDFRHSTTGASITRYSSLERELLAHEMLGHGLGRSTGSATFGHADAIQLTNLYLRVKGVNWRYRDGTVHGTGVAIPQATATAIPAYLQRVP